MFDISNSMKEYVYLIGRVFRFGEEGNVIVFVNEENKKIFLEFVDLLKLFGVVVFRELVNLRYIIRFVFVSKS